jgi:hypothetical protein
MTNLLDQVVLRYRPFRGISAQRRDYIARHASF